MEIRVDERKASGIYGNIALAHNPEQTAKADNLCTLGALMGATPIAKG